MHTLSIRNLIKKTADIQGMMTLGKVRAASISQDAYNNLRVELSRNLRDTVEDVERIFNKNNQSAASLPIRSRRAYQWVKFLSIEEHFQRHLDALQRINLFLPGFPRSRRITKLGFEFALYHINPLYKIRERNDSVELVTQESFYCAPDKVLIALLEVALQSQPISSRQIIRDYTASSQYKTTREYLEYLSRPEDGLAVGKTYNLDHSFGRVNQKYFGGRMAKPHLVWNNQITHRKFGHYQDDTNTIVVSISLDHPRVPRYVLDYVMFHELLHKQLGARQVKNRRYTHTNEFKSKENQYARITEAKQILRSLSRRSF
jgi:hypothetical protein